MTAHRDSITLTVLALLVYILALLYCQPHRTEPDHVAPDEIKRKMVYHGPNNVYFVDWEDRVYFYREGKRIFI
ncbi:MAG: hypothetical protein WC750_06410 [Patescibacteria group bacterium]|jgi:hypothetical protein